MRTTLLAFALLATAAPALAQEGCDARCHFQRGQSAYETGDYETAVNEWRAAYDMDSRPALQYNLAQAYERLGRYDEAVRSYEVYISAAPADDQRAQNARARVASLQQRVSNTSVLLTGGVEGAQIFIDGADRGRLPHPDALRVDPGSHRIVVRAEGYQDFVSTVAVSPGQAATVEIEMTPGVSGTASTGGGGPSLIGISILAVGGAVLIAGAITGGLALATVGNARTMDDVGPIEDARTLALVTDVLLPVGGVAAVTGLVLMFVLRGGGGAASTTQLVPVVGPGYAGLSLAGEL
jgi:tetratricopeptide (TPR) repeat protein